MKRKLIIITASVVVVAGALGGIGYLAKNNTSVKNTTTLTKTNSDTVKQNINLDKTKPEIKDTNKTIDKTTQLKESSNKDNKDSKPTTEQSSSNSTKSNNLSPVLTGNTGQEYINSKGQVEVVKVFKDGVTKQQLDSDRENIIKELHNLNESSQLMNMNVPITNNSLIDYIPQTVICSMGSANGAVTNYLNNMKELYNKTLDTIKGVVTPQYYKCVLDEQRYDSYSSQDIDPQISQFKNSAQYQEIKNLVTAYAYAQVIYSNANTYLNIDNQPKVNQ